MRALFLVTAIVAGVPALARAAEAPEVSGVVVIGRAPLSGADADRELAAGAVTVLKAEDLQPGAGSRLLGALDRLAPGAALGNAQGDAYQPSLFYRGFEASPLQGAPQGLAVYVDGVRFNQPFGETVNWDLIPEVAIESLTLEGANPVFGLNAIGGSLSVRLKTGFDDPGGELEALGGSFGRRELQAQYGAASERLGVYVAATGLRDRGWRAFSPTKLRQDYAGLGWRDGPWSLDLGLTAADNDLTGEGPAPVELLAVDRRAVFTHPDVTRNRFGQLRLAGSWRASPALLLQAQAYSGRLRQTTANADVSDAEACEADPSLLCLGEAGPLLTDGSGAPIHAFLAEGPYAALNSTATDTARWGAGLQLASQSPVFGRANSLTLGASLDAARTRFSAQTLLGALTADRGFGGPGVLVDQAEGPITPVALTARSAYLGAYVTDTLSLGSRLSLTLSGRFDVAKIKLSDRLGAALEGDHTFRRFNPAAGATWRLSERLTAYAGYAEAGRAPTPAELSCASPADPCSLANFFLADPPLKAVKARTFEAGLRGRGAAGGLAWRWSVGLFRTDTRDDIAFVASPFFGRGFFQNVGRTRRQGGEAQVEATAGRWRAFANYALTEATFRSPLTLTSPDNPAADAEGEIHVRPGDRMPGVPRHRGKLGLEYDPGRWRAGFNLVASSGRPLFGDEANLQPDTGGYVVANLDAAVRLGRKVELFATVENLTDVRYATFGTFTPTAEVPLREAPGATDPRALTPGPPRAVEAGVRLRF